LILYSARHAVSGIHQLGAGACQEGGLLDAVAFFLAIVSWFTILLAGTHPSLHRSVLRALLLLVDEYPPFSLT
jgi:hypothetical protein